MNKNGSSKTKYCIQSEKHHSHTSLGLCSLMEHQSLVDIAICCGNNTLHAHKVVLAANSPLFREELEKNACIEQVIISGCDFSVIRSIIEFMYCGETTISEDYIKYLVAAAKSFQMRSLENLTLERTDYQFAGDVIVLPRPQFLSKKPKYPSYPFNTNSVLIPNNISKPFNYNVNNLYKPHKVKRKFRLEAEHQACMKEAQASRLAIANLKKEIASAPQTNTFIIEETCTETTVENFIPHTEPPRYLEVEYNNIGNQVFVPQNHLNQEMTKPASMIQLALQNNGQGLTADRIKHILGSAVPSNVEIMFKTNDGSFVTVTDEVLQNLSTKDGLQYQVVDENGHVGEVQELQVISDENIVKLNKNTTQNVPNKNHNPDLLPVTTSEDYITNHFLDTSHFLFNSTSQTNTAETECISLENAKKYTRGSLFPTENSPKKRTKDMCTLDTVEIKQSLLDCKTKSEIKIDEIITIDNNVNNLKLLKTGDIPVDNDNKYKITVVDLSSVSPRRTRSSLKFSPDMFFADVSANNSGLNIEEPESKKINLNRRKKP